MYCLTYQMIKYVVQKMNLSHRRKLKITVLAGTLVCWICLLSFNWNPEVWKRSVKETDLKSSYEARTDLDMNPTLKILKTGEHTRCIYISAKPKATVNTSSVSRSPSDRDRWVSYPEDVFTLEQRRHGWVLLHISALLYFFFALVIVCEEFFIPALRILTVRLDVSEELSALNFMAAGGFLPEFFISLIGIFLSSAHVGVGVMVGCGFFNVLVVMGACAVFSDETLALTWWPFCRDVMFYICDVFILLVILMDDIITWRESVFLLMGCVMYVIFIKNNELLETTVKVYPSPAVCG